MSIWSKVLTALRGGVHEVGEAIADTQTLRVLDQEVRDANEELNNSKNSLAEMMAKQKVAEQKCITLNAKITEFETYAIQALEKNEESLALQLAEKIADLEQQLSLEQTKCNDYTNHADKLRNAIKLADDNIKQLKHQLEMVKATEDVQRTQATVTQRHSDSNSKLTKAMDSLERIKEKQDLKNAQFDVAQELAENESDNTLNHRLEAAGIVPKPMNGDAVLARLKSEVTPQLQSDSHSK